MKKLLAWVLLTIAFIYINCYEDIGSSPSPGITQQEYEQGGNKCYS